MDERTKTSKMMHSRVALLTKFILCKGPLEVQCCHQFCQVTQNINCLKSPRVILNLAGSESVVDELQVKVVRLLNYGLRLMNCRLRRSSAEITKLSQCI